MYIYKVLTEDEWSMASKSGEIITDLDQKDGFIHCSLSDQLALTPVSYTHLTLPTSSWV